MPVDSERQQGCAGVSISDIPPSAEERLIDVGFSHFETSVAGRAERYGRGETLHTIHVWWARRPHTAMRALVFAALAKGDSPTARGYLDALAANATVPETVLEEVRAFLASQYDAPPRVLDMFGGGGTIPFEALSLGADSCSVDSNPLAVFIQRCLLQYLRHPGHDWPQLVRDSGERTIERLADLTADLFPLRASTGEGLFPSRSGPIAYIWTYTKFCSRCGFKYFLTKRPWLSKKRGRNIGFERLGEDAAELLVIRDQGADAEFETHWVGRNGKARCPKCEHVEDGIEIGKCNDELVALVTSKSRNGKAFSAQTDGAIPSKSFMVAREQSLLAELDLALPNTELPRWSGIVNPALYGIRTHSDFIGQRQRLVLLCLIKSLRAEYEWLRTHASESVAQAVVAVLSALIDQLVDWNCRLSMWIPQNEQVGRGFCGPGVSMLWDYAEIDPVLNGPANLGSKLNRIVAGVEFAAGRVPADVRIGEAQHLPFASESFDAIVTDPPYYDNLYYTVLADFFYAWKKPVLSIIDPELFRNPSTDRDVELTASVQRSGSRNEAHEKYCSDFAAAISEAERVLKPNGVFALVFSHSATRGWDAVVRAFQRSSLRVTAVQPLSIERRQRPRAVSSEAINTCLAFVSHKDDVHEKAEVELEHVIGQLEYIAKSDFSTDLKRAGWCDEDIALAVFAQGIGMLCNGSSVAGHDDPHAAICGVAAAVKEWHPKLTVSDRRSL